MLLADEAQPKRAWAASLSMCARSFCDLGVVRCGAVVPQYRTVVHGLVGCSGVLVASFF